MSGWIRRGIEHAGGIALPLYDVLHPGPARVGRALAAPAGANPVVLVGGFATAPNFLDVWRRSLEADGFRVFVTDDPTNGLGSVRDAAVRLAATVRRAQAQTGAPKVDVVTYSAGVAVARAWLSLGDGARLTERLVAVDGSWRGDDDRRLLDRVGSVPVVGRTMRDALPRALFDLQRGSELYRQLARRLELPPGVRVSAVFPDRATEPSWIPGARNVQLHEPIGHLAMARSSATAYEALRAELLRHD